jgi:hypothetical protein
MKLRKNLVLRKLGPNYMIVDVNADCVDLAKVYTMNATCANLWSKITEQDLDVTPETLAGLLCEEYDVAYDLALKDVSALIDKWKINDLLEER